MIVELGLVEAAGEGVVETASAWAVLGDFLSSSGGKVSMYGGLKPSFLSVLPSVGGERGLVPIIVGVGEKRSRLGLVSSFPSFSEVAWMIGSSDGGSICRLVTGLLDVGSILEVSQTSLANSRLDSKEGRVPALSVGGPDGVVRLGVR